MMTQQKISQIRTIVLILSNPVSKISTSDCLKHEALLSYHARCPSSIALINCHWKCLYILNYQEQCNRFHHALVPREYPYYHNLIDLAEQEQEASVRTAC